MGFGSVSSLILQLLDFVSEQIGPDAAEKISERFTVEARRAIFFAHYEADSYGS
jgi:hypothetical protein